MATTDYARGQDWYVEAAKPHGGFCFIHEGSIHAAWGYLRSGEIVLRDFRAWLACHELQARRCTLERERNPRFTSDELHGLVGGVGGEHIRRSLRALERVGLLRFREDDLDTVPHEVGRERGRMVPVPRRLLRLVCQSSGRAFVATVLGHLLRCMYYRRGMCRSGGWCKASWVADTFGVAVRAVKQARSKLAKLGVLRVVNADQTRLNRFGRPIRFCLDWGTESAPHSTQSTTKSAPPREHKKLSYRRVDHQKPARASDTAGVCRKIPRGGLRNVRAADLEQPRRVAALFRHAWALDWVHKTEADALAVFAAAAHALRVGTRNQAGLFRWLVERRYWSVLSIDDENRGRAMLAKLRGLNDAQDRAA